MNKKIKLLIVDDSALIRKMFTGFFASDPDIEVVGSAEDPYDAREKIKLLNPDVITLDIEMPKMDGITFLGKIMSLRPMPVVMVSTLTHKGASSTLKALEIGAVDYVGKPQNYADAGALLPLREELIAKVKVAAKAKVREYVPSEKIETSKTALSGANISGDKKIIAIGSSTGGIQALVQVFQELPATLPPIAIVQHIHSEFVDSLVKRLDEQSAVTVKVAEHGEMLKKGHAYISPGEVHLGVKKEGGILKVDISDGPAILNHRPSVNLLYHSVAEVFGGKAVAVILTGMGKDGADGMVGLKEAGAVTIGQDERSCVVYGMPKAAKNAGAISKELPIQKIAGEIVNSC